MNPASQTLARLKEAGLRPTRQRLALGELLFAGEDRHCTAEQLHQEVTASGIEVSLATVYNTLHQFTAAGLLRQVVAEPGQKYFDTNTGPHHHFYHEHSGHLEDIAHDNIAISGLPTLPEGTRLSQVDVIIRVKSA